MIGKKISRARAAPASKKPTKSAASSKSSSKTAPAKKSRNTAPESEDEMEEDDGKTAQRVMRQLNRSPKEQLVADLLCRWWYVLPDWPPTNFDYAPVLAQNKLRLVSLDTWEFEQDVDKAGFVKCYSLSQYKGLFRGATGFLHDLRPIKGKPCFSEFIKRSEKELTSLLVEAITKQLVFLNNSNELNKGVIIAELNEKLKTYSKRK